MTEQELMELRRRVDADDPAAMFEYAELIAGDDPQEADKFIVLSAQLGYPRAVDKMGDKYLALGDEESAAHCFKTGAKAGILDCSVKLAIMDLKLHEHTAVRELEDLAQIGIQSACAALADYYRERGNRKESAYWRSMLK